MPQAADSSNSSSCSESSTGSEMGLVDVCTIHCENSETESRCRGGPVTLDDVFRVEDSFLISIA